MKTGNCKFIKGGLLLSFLLLFLQMSWPLCTAYAESEVTFAEPFSAEADQTATSSAYYQPEEMQGMDLSDPSSRWCWARSRESEHFFCFWEEGFGMDPGSQELPASMQVDVDDLLTKAEQFWHTNVERVQMVTAGEGVSMLDTYKMQIYLLYTEEWVATGSGYDDVIGALWVSPMTCHPVGSVIAHEVAHCFQYQVYCDQLWNQETADFQSGFRYGYDEVHAGNPFWEQCAQWVATLDYPESIWEEMGNWPQLCNLAFEHEWTRYQSFWLPMFWARERGENVIGAIWRESHYPEDALHAYARIFCDEDWERVGDELYHYAISLLDFFVLESATCFADSDGWQQISYASCPEVGGCCFIALPIDTQCVSFQGLPMESPLAANDPGIYRVTDPETDEPIPGGRVTHFNAASNYSPGWRYGLAAIDGAGQITLGEMGSSDQGEVMISLPEEVASEYFIVVGTPQNFPPNPWDDDESTDAKFPFRYKIAEP